SVMTAKRPTMVSQRSHCFAYGSKHHSPGWNCFIARRIYGERCAVSITPLKSDFVTFCCGEQLEVAARRASSFARILDHPIDVVVGVGRLVMKQRDAPCLSLDGDVGHVIGAAVPPAATFRVLL